MRRPPLRAVLLLALLLPLPLNAQEGGMPAGLTARIDAIFQPFDREDSPGYALGIVRHGRLVYARGYGRANLDYDVPITPRTAFHLASLSKQFTAAAIALLILDGKLSPESRVADYVPEVAKFGADLRVKHLVYFTSGLPEYTSLRRPNGDPWFSAYYFTIDDAIASTLSADSLLFEPGSDWAYSNVNYMLLARIVERVSGMPLSRFLDKRVFGPLGMTNTHLDDDATLVVPGRATGYASRSDPRVVEALAGFGIHVRPGDGWVRLLRNSPHYGGSGVISTVEDLATWDRNFYTHALAGPEFTALMLLRMRFSHPKDNDAFGLVHGEFAGHPMVWFSGEDLDASTYMARLPQDSLTVICLSNMPTGEAEARAMDVLSLLLPLLSPVPDEPPPAGPSWWESGQ